MSTERGLFDLTCADFGLIRGITESWDHLLSRSIAAVREQFIEQCGLIAQAEALPRIAGRILGLMVFDGKDYSFSEIAEELQISRGSVSSSVSLLTAMGVIERTAKPGDRQDYFRLSEDPYTTFFARARNRAERAHKTIQETRDAVPKDKREIRSRLKEYETFYATLIKALDSGT